MKFLDQMDVKGKKLLIRCDFNVPLKNGEIQDDNRIQASLETLRYALDNNASLVLCSHLGKPKGNPDPELTMKPVAERLGELLGLDVRLAPDCVGSETRRMAQALGPGEVLLLENLRFHPEEKDNDPHFSRELAELAEIYVCDAFGTAHRAHASMVGVAAHAADCCGGLLLKKEWHYLKEALESPERPYVAISGGAKVSTKLGVLFNLLDTVDELIIGGAMANTFMLAKGYETGTSLVEKDLAEKAVELLETANRKGVKVHLPVDFVVGDSPDAAEALGTFAADSLPGDKMALDIGPKSVELFTEAISKARTVMWNGPMGAFENPAFAEGSVAVAKAMASLEDARTIVGGGDTDALIHRNGLVDDFSFISTGGGSFLEFLEGKELPAFTALKECAER